jgi:hypothetical protein
MSDSPLDGVLGPTLAPSAALPRGAGIPWLTPPLAPAGEDPTPLAERALLPTSRRLPAIAAEIAAEPLTVVRLVDHFRPPQSTIQPMAPAPPLAAPATPAGNAAQSASPVASSRSVGQPQLPATMSSQRQAPVSTRTGHSPPAEPPPSWLPAALPIRTVPAKPAEPVVTPATQAFLLSGDDVGRGCGGPDRGRERARRGSEALSG